MVATETKELTPIERAGVAHLLELREIVGTACDDTLTEIDECLARLGVTAVTFLPGGEVL